MNLFVLHIAIAVIIVLELLMLYIVLSGPSFGAQCLSDV